MKPMADFPMLAAEFPDYELATLPAIPADWAESSWHNDACPSFMARDDKLHIFVDYAYPEAREWPDIGFRFSVSHIDEAGDIHQLLETDDWQAVTSFVETWKPPAD
jgi:hypothetical protein